MKKSDWDYLAKAMWAYAKRQPKRNQRISRLLKQLVITINKNNEVIIDDMGEFKQTNGSNRPNDNNTTGNTDFTGLE
jgi:nucleoid DNA-binding protein